MAWWAERQSVGDVTNTIGCNEQMKFFGRAPRIFLVLNKTQCFWWTVTVANNASSYWQAAVVISHQTHHPSKRGEELNFFCPICVLMPCLYLTLGMFLWSMARGVRWPGQSEVDKDVQQNVYRMDTLRPGEEGRLRSSLEGVRVVDAQGRTSPDDQNGVELHRREIQVFQKRLNSL